MTCKLLAGFGLLETGCVSPKNEVSIFYKNAVDVLFGGIMYWLIGFGLSFGEAGSSSFSGWGYWALTAIGDRDSVAAGRLYASFIFQVRILVALPIRTT